MARGRMLDKSISASYQIHDLPDWPCKLLATWLIAHLDKNGVFYGDAPMVRSQVFPLEDVSNAQVEEYLQAMEQSCDGDGEPLMVRFAAQGRLWQYWPGFERHQSGLRKDRERTAFPPPPDASRQLPGNCPATASNVEDEYNVNECNATETNASDALPSPALNAWVQARGGAVNSLDVDQILDLVVEFETFRLMLPRGSPGADLSGETWVAEAILAANSSRQGKLITLGYVRGVLDRWRGEGYKAQRTRDPASALPMSGPRVIDLGRGA